MSIENSAKVFAEFTYELGYKDGREAYAPKWISVEERLPSNTRKVLIYTRRHKTFISYYNPIDGMWGYDYDYDITHWMKLPEAPEGDE